MVAEARQWALFRERVLVSKAHSTLCAAYVEAFERGAVVNSGRYRLLADGYEIKELDNENQRL